MRLISSTIILNPTAINSACAYDVSRYFRELLQPVISIPTAPFWHPSTIDALPFPSDLRFS